MKDAQKLFAVLNNTVDGIVVIDSKGIIEYMNASGLKTFGYQTEELIGKSVNVLIPSNFADRHDFFIEHYLKTGSSQVVGNRRKINALRKDGTQFKMWLSINEIGGEEQKFSGIFQDMSEYEQQEANLSESQKRLNAIIETAVDGIITIDGRGIVESMNPAAAKLFGYEAHEIIGKNVKVLMPEPHHAQHDTYIDNYKKTGERKIIGIGRDVRGKRKDGTEFPFKLSISEVHLKDKRLFTGIIHDTSDRERAMEVELALERMNELNELKSRFISTASHEFRTPLTSIGLSANLIDRYKSEEDAPKRKKHIDRIQNSVKTLKTILEDFLSLTKLEEGKIENQPLYFDLKEFCSEIAEEMQELIDGKLQIIHEHKGIEKVFLDKKLLRNILHNLLSNAIKYSGTGEKVYLTSEVDDKRVSLVVRDEGIGIPVTEQKELFSRFFRAKNVTNIQGTGLGLNIVSRYLELMEGNIRFESEEGVGTTFWLEFPNK